MKSIKTKLLFTILGVVFGFGILVFTATVSQLVMQKNTIKQQGAKQASELSAETKETLTTMNEQTATDFSGSCAKYFALKFSVIQKHVQSIQEKTQELYQEKNDYGGLDEKVGIVKGVSRSSISREFSMISPIRDFIQYLPEYDADDLDSLDLYVVTESGMCLDGTGETYQGDYTDLRREDWYQNAKATGTVYWSGVFKGKVSKKEKVICAIPIYNENGTFMGCAAGDMVVGAFQEILEEFDEEQILSVIFFDKDGETMYATNGYENEDTVKQYLGDRDTVSNGKEVYSFVPLEETGWTICLVLDQTQLVVATDALQDNVEKNVEGIVDIVQGSMQRIILIIGVIVAVLVVLALLVSNFLAAGLVRPIRQLMSQVKEVGEGNLDQQIAVRSKDEIGQLAESFGNMTGALKTYMEHLRTATADKERMTAELSVAKQIQMNMLPKCFPAFPDRSDFDIYAWIVPQDKGGGNFYDFFLVDKTHLCMVLGDVTGTGIPTTLFAVITKTHIKNYAQLGYRPDRILAETNNQLSSGNEAGRTVSVFLGLVDLKDGVLEYVNAGQMAPLWKHSGNDFSFLESKTCFALGSMENVPYGKQSVRLSQGDMLFMHTRGVSETADAKGNIYTQEYLQEFVNGIVRHQYRLTDIADGVRNDLARFAGDEEQEKDSTVLVFRYAGR